MNVIQFYKSKVILYYNNPQYDKNQHEKINIWGA